MFYEKINLQLFADTQVTTQPSLSAEMKTFYDMTLIDEASANLVHDQFAQKRPIPQGGGKTIEFRKFAPLNKALTPLTEGVTPAGNSLTVSTITATVAQYGDFIVQSDVLELTALDNTIIEATKLLGQQAGRTLDTVTRNVLNSGANVSYASKWNGSDETIVTKRSDLDATSVLKVDTVNQIVAKLRSVNAPTIDGKYVAIIHPFVAYDLMRDPEWIDAHKYATPENLYAGEIGEVGGVRFVQTSEAKVFVGTGLITSASYNGATTTIAFTGKLDGEAVTEGALVGKYIRINGKIVSITANTASNITIASTNFGTISNGAAIEICDCSAGAVFSTLFIANGAYGVTEVTGGGLQTIVKQKGSSGTADPLDQRSSVGWKAIKTAELLIPDYIVRAESCSGRFSSTTTAN